MNIYGIAASTREGSLNSHLHGRLSERLVAQGHRVETLDYGIVENLPHYTAAREAEPGIPEDVRTIAAAIHAADGLLITSPEFNFSIPGPFKNAIDWISRIRPRVFVGKPVLVSSASPSRVGGWRGLAALRISLTCLGAQVLHREVYVGGVENAEHIDDFICSGTPLEQMETALTSLTACSRQD